MADLLLALDVKGKEKAVEVAGFIMMKTLKITK